MRIPPIAGHLDLEQGAMGPADINVAENLGDI